MPVVSGEARYEALMIGHMLDATDARQAFWAHLITRVARAYVRCEWNLAGSTAAANVRRFARGNNWGTTPWATRCDCLAPRNSPRQTSARNAPVVRLEPHPEWAASLRRPAGENTDRFDGAQWIWFPEGDPVADAPWPNASFARI